MNKRVYKDEQILAVTYACPKCKDMEEPQFIKDNGKPAMIPHSYVSESLLAYILYRKYGLYIRIFLFTVRKKTSCNRQSLSEEHPWHHGLSNPVRCTYVLCMIIFTGNC